MKKQNISRRKLLKYGLHGIGATALAAALPQYNYASIPVNKIKRENGKIVVIGAGAFGGWTALHLLRKGYQVILVDQFGPGNNQASSGGETRLIRAYYGDQQIYFDMVLRSLELWKENEKAMGRKILHQNGLVQLNQDAIVADAEVAIAMYKNAGLTLEKLSAAEAAKRWPQIKTSDLDHVLYDPVSGYLEAREGCRAVVDLFQKEGGTFKHQHVKNHIVKGDKTTSVILADNSILEADTFIFACGPWLVRQFPELVKKLKVTRQGYFFFATPPEFSDLIENKLPCWLNRPSDGNLAYGIPGNAYRGFKVAFTLKTDDITNKFDTYNRYLKPEELEQAKQILASRFPNMSGRPLIEQRVCQYTETPDKDFILDKHPDISNLWIIGGGSGHGYKHGAAFGELASNNISGEKPILEKFKLKRLVG